MTDYERTVLERAVMNLDYLKTFLQAEHAKTTDVIEQALEIVKKELQPRFFAEASYASKNGNRVKFSKTFRAKDSEDALITMEAIARTRKSFSGKLDILVKPLD